MIKTNQKNNHELSNPLLTKDDGLFEKLEEKKQPKKAPESIFSRDVNDLSERVYD